MSTTAVTPAVKVPFLTRFKNWFKKIVGELPKAITLAETAIEFSAPLLNSIESQVDPADAPAVAAEVTKIQAALATVGALAEEGDTVGASAALSQAQSSLGSLLTNVNIKDPATVEKVTGITSTILGELSALATEFHS